MSKAMSMSSHSGGHLYMLTNEIPNCVVHVAAFNPTKRIKGKTIIRVRP